MARKTSEAKKQIGDRIRETALEVFFEKGYANATMREIARRAGMTIGNIYYYYRNKEELHDALLSPALEELNRLIEIGQAKILQQHSLEGGLLAENYTRAAAMFRKYRNNLLILFRRNTGTKYEGIRERFIFRMAELISNVAQEYAREAQGRVGKDGTYFLLLGNFWVESFLTIVEYVNEENKAAQALQDSVEVIFHAIKRAAL